MPSIPLTEYSRSVTTPQNLQMKEENGLMRLRYLKEHRSGLFNRLTLSGKLYAHLLEVEDAAQDLLDSMMPGMAKEAGATEGLKARDPMRWVGLMNCCKAQAEEIIFAELIMI